MTDERKPCFSCKDCLSVYRGQSTGTSLNKPVATDTLTDKACFSCCAEINLLDLTVKVSGQHAEDVKVVSSYLVEQISEIKYQTAKTKNLNVLEMKLKNNNMKLLLIAIFFFMSVFFGILYALTGLAISNIGWYKFISILMSLPVFLILTGVLALKFIGGMEEAGFLELVRLVLRLIYDTIKLLWERKGANDEK